MTDWANDPAMIQAIATVALVGVTIFYAIRTHTVASATESMAKETGKMARLDHERP